MAGSVHIPWYATGFRADKFEEALREIAPVALRYGATSYAVYRYRDDRYRFLHTSTFESKLDWERFWGGEEMTRFRVNHQGWYQVPLVYQWADVAIEGSLPRNGQSAAQPTSVTSGNGGNGAEVGDTM